MAKRSRRLAGRITALLALIVVALCVFGSIQARNGEEGYSLPDIPYIDEIYDYVSGLFPEPGSSGGSGSRPDNALEVSGDLAEGVAVHILDMGQADSILIQTPSANVLIDAGENNQGQQVMRYLQELGVREIHYLIATHPHSDHIGGMDTVLLNFPVGQVLMAPLPEEIVPTSRTFTDLLDAIEEKEVPLTSVWGGDSVDLGGGAYLNIIGPVEDINDLNNMSIVCQLIYRETSFLFTGDCSEEEESSILSAGISLRSIVLDAGHHGSRTAGGDDFLDAVSPQIVTISCGIDNSYGHPHPEVLEALEARRITVFRTDLNGRISIYSDGRELSVITER